MPNDFQRLVVLQKGFVDFGKAFEDGGIGGQLLAHLDEGSDNEDTHADGFRAVQYCGGHDSAMLGEGPRQGFGKLELGEVITICDHLRFLCDG